MEKKVVNRVCAFEMHAENHFHGSFPNVITLFEKKLATTMF